MAIKFSAIITTILLLLTSCSKSEGDAGKDEISIETKIIKKTDTYQNNDVFHIDAQIPIILGLDLGLENIIKEWKAHKKAENLEEKTPKESNHEYFYHSEFEIFENEDLQVTSILYSQYTIEQGAANGITTYHPINLRGNKMIQISDIISKDQLDSLMQVLKEQVKKEVKEFSKGDINQSLSKDSFEDTFKKNKYYFKNNNVIFFYDPLTISDHASGKIEFTFPVNKNTEN
ncbi:RsiV family protein [Borrelia sp. RT5S]|uniref:RsiV family protein n=1 Tax=Borrelia sp. RT5S TaxID=2898581 RepID=UPI001E3D56E5|nr:RsiV family protein [Borrelia sp. RT5S]UGQ16140.1 RsiV family protein [Borrelia sp. RT5S]